MATTPVRATRLARHELDGAQIDALASGKHDDGAIAVLRGAEHSRRLLALRLLLHSAREHASAVEQLSPVDDAWGLFVRAQHDAPEVAAELLTLPQLGVWTSYALRRLREKTDDGTPLWFHIGQLHVLAAAAGIRAGLEFRLTVPLWDGAVTLPTVGSARLPSPAEWSTAEVVSGPGGAIIRTATGSVEVGAADAGRWRPWLTVDAGSGDTAFALAVDDMSPYRGLSTPTRPEPLTEAEIAEWTSLTRDAWRGLLRHHRGWARELSAGMVSLTPRPAAFRLRQHSASVGDGFGLAIASTPHDAVQLSVTLVHEFQHSKLNAIEHLSELTLPDPALECYAPWRDDPRPTAGFLHGVYAFAAVAEFWELERRDAAGDGRELADFEFAMLREQLVPAVGELQARQSLTEQGRRFVDGLADRISSWRQPEVSAETARWAAFAAADHLASWRAAHLRPDWRFVEAAVAAWAAGKPAPALPDRSAVVPSEQPHLLDLKATLIRLLMIDRQAFDLARSRVNQDEPLFKGAGEGDFALVLGDADEAREHYGAELSTGSDRPGAWSGLGLALDAIAPGPASAALRERPEVVRAVYRKIREATGRAPGVEEVTGWLVAGT